MPRKITPRRNKNTEAMVRVLCIIEIVQNSKCPEELAVEALEKIRRTILSVFTGVEIAEQNPSSSSPLDPAEDPNADITVICAWCKKIMHQGDPNLLASHGICEDCARELGYDAEEEE